MNKQILQSIMDKAGLSGWTATLSPAQCKNRLGRTNHTNKTIQINGKLRGELVNIVAYHEVAHAMLSNVEGHGENHKNAVVAIGGKADWATAVINTKINDDNTIEVMARSI